MSWFSDSLTGERLIKQAQCQDVTIFAIFFVSDNVNKYGVLKAMHFIACTGGVELGSGKGCFGYFFYSFECWLITYFLFSVVPCCLMGHVPSRLLTREFHSRLADSKAI